MRETAGGLGIAAMGPFARKRSTAVLIVACLLLAACGSTVPSDERAALRAEDGLGGASGNSGSGPGGTGDATSGGDGGGGNGSSAGGSGGGGSGAGSGAG